jgi:16S rRNA (cytosine967-C5)-methyltransferase
VNPKSLNIRGAAIDVLCRWEEQGETVGHGLERHGSMLDQRDRQLLQSLVFGVIRWRGYFDWLIAQFSSHPLAGMKCRTRQALRVGLVQLLVMDRIPAAAAINETVLALKTARQPGWLTGFVNGLLRQVERRRAEIATPWQRPEELPLAARVSHPPWLLDRWLQRYGLGKTMAICTANNTPPVLCLRVNTRKVSVERFLGICWEAGLMPQQGGFAPAAVRLPGYRGLVTAIPGYAEGYFQIQDEAAQLVSLLLAPAGAGNYLDACAGLGGKTTHLAELLPVQSRLTALEPNPKKIDQLKANLNRLDLTGKVTITIGELETLHIAQPELFRGILVDAPCSGLGVIRRHPDIRWNRTAEELERYQEKQLALLVEAARLLAPDGVLVYATCSTEPEENEQVVERFCGSRDDIAGSDCREFLPEAAASLIDGRGYFQTLPGEQEMDGFFAARLVKKGRMENNA